jgi:hypothetical protein
MRLGEPIAGLEHVADQLRSRQRSLLRQQVLEVVAFEVFHDEVRHIPLDPRVEQADRVLPSQTHGGADLSLEARGRPGLVRGGQEHLHRHVLPELPVSCPEDDPHASPAQLRLQLVLPPQQITRNRDLGDNLSSHEILHVNSTPPARAGHSTLPTGSLHRGEGSPLA